MEPTPPPWRVFDAPAARPDGSADPPPAGAPEPVASLATLRAVARPSVIAMLGAAAVCAILAVVIATGSMAGGTVVVDGSSARPLGSSDATAGTAAAGSELVVDVAGAVLRPGLYRLPPGSRVGDAIAAAGGYSPRVAADVAGSSLNLAARVQDGQLVVVPSRDDPSGGGSSGGSSGSAGSGGASSPGSGGPAGASRIDLNTATAEQLDTLPGIGPVTAAKILASRADNPFRAVSDLLDRKLVGQKTFDQIRSLVTVG